jgi:hypothetical protein
MGVPNVIAAEDTDIPRPEEEEAEDSFPVTDDAPLVIDRQSMDRIARASRPGPTSVTTTELASSVGSVVGRSKDAFLKSITFYKDRPEMGWGIRFADPTSTSRRKQKLYVERIEGSLALSRILPQDYLKTINGKKVGPSFNAARALERMEHCFENEGVLSVVTANKDLNADDILVHATILKPRPSMTYEQLGMVVWNWPMLCIKSIDKNSIFKHSVLTSTDHIVSVNDIECGDLKPPQFKEIIDALPLEITITVLRRKQRWSGKFG